MEIFCFSKFDIKKRYGTIDQQCLVFIFLEEIHDHLLIAFVKLCIIVDVFFCDLHLQRYSSNGVGHNSFLFA
jgi:hypothetical protein